MLLRDDPWRFFSVHAPPESHREGCTPIPSLPDMPEATPDESEALQAWQGSSRRGGVVLLLERGTCSFAEKALEAQRLGVDAVLVADYASTSALANLNNTATSTGPGQAGPVGPPGGRVKGLGGLELGQGGAGTAETRRSRRSRSHQSQLEATVENEARNGTKLMDMTVGPSQSQREAAGQVLLPTLAVSRSTRDLIRSWLDTGYSVHLSFDDNSEGERRGADGNGRETTATIGTTDTAVRKSTTTARRAGNTTLRLWTSGDDSDEGRALVAALRRSAASERDPDIWYQLGRARLIHGSRSLPFAAKAFQGCIALPDAEATARHPCLLDLARVRVSVPFLCALVV